MNFPIIDVYNHPHYGDSVRYENYVELQEVAEKIEARVARLEEALKPFADEACEYDPDEGDDGLFAFDTTIKIGQLRAARRALEEK